MDRDHTRQKFDRLFWFSVSATLLFSAVAGAGLTYGPDFRSIRAAQTLANPVFDAVGNLFSTLGDVEVVSVAFCVFCGALFLTGRRELAVRLVIAYAVVNVVELLMKLFLPVARIPDDLGRTADYTPTVDVAYSYPYPSGHMLRATMLFGAVYVLWPNRYGRVAVVVFLILMALTRIYLGVHWPSDMIGGALLGMAGLAWVFRSAGSWTKRK